MRPDATDSLQTAKNQFELGRLQEAERILEPIFTRDEHNLEALVLLGAIEAKTGRAAQAKGHLESALQLSPGRYDAITWLAMAHRALGEFEAAISLLERATGLRPDDASARNLLGLCQLESGKPADAAKSFASAISLEPNAGQGYYNLGMAHRLQNNVYEAAEAFRRAVELAPDHAQGYVQLFRQLQQLSQWDEAIMQLEQGLRRLPNSVAIAEALATAYGRTQRSSEAETIFKRIANVDSGAAQTYADWLQERGRFEDSIRVLKKSIAVRPVQGPAYRGLAEAKAFTFEDGTLVEKVLAVIDDPGLDDKAHMHLNYALGKAYEASGEYEASIRRFDAANALAYRSYPASSTFDAALIKADPKIMASVYRRELIEELRGSGSSSEQPIFVVGMIRSGTTLLDQILSSHRSIRSAGEDPFWGVEGDRVHRKWREHGPDAGDVRDLSDRYLSNVRGLVGDAERVSDKMPLNFRHLGLISIVFPRAKILHIRRDPLDTCLSIYTTFFAGGPNFTYKQRNIVDYYRSYQRFMEHWRQVLPGDRFHELNYEELVKDQETTTRRLIEFLELPWDEACLRHDRNVEAVTTPSRWQARQPIYQSSVERWRRFEPWLGQLLELREG